VVVGLLASKIVEQREVGLDVVGNAVEEPIGLICGN
jgi:hypothetical protein